MNLDEKCRKQVRKRHKDKTNKENRTDKEGLMEVGLLTLKFKCSLRYLLPVM